MLPLTVLGIILFESQFLCERHDEDLMVLVSLDAIAFLSIFKVSLVSLLNNLPYRAIDEAIRTGQFVRNKALRYWIDNKGVNKYDLNKYCRVIAKEYSFG